MKKADGPIYNASSDNGEDEFSMFDIVSSLDVVNTFEQSDVNSCKIAGENCFVYLNKFSCFFLNSRGVPKELFRAKVEDELSRILHIVTDRDVAVNMVRKLVAHRVGAVGLENDEVEGDGEDCDGIELDDLDGGSSSNSSQHDGESLVSRRRERGLSEESHHEWMTRISSLNVPDERSFAELALEFLNAGHDVTEPVLSRHLKNIQLEEVKKLQKFKIRIAGGYNLPGICFCDNSSPPPLHVMM